MNGWLKWVLGVLITVVLGVNAYAFTLVLPTISTHVIENDKSSRERDAELEKTIVETRLDVVRLESMEVKLDSIQEDVKEFKNLLKRGVPNDAYQLDKNVGRSR